MNSILIILVAFVAPCYGAYVRGDSYNSDIRSLQTVTNSTNQIPIETYFVPLPEEALHKELFKKIDVNASSTITAIISIAVANNNTWIWYDHWEDGYDLDVANRTSNTTQIWGDGNASNGCRPGQATCTNANDRLNPGTSIVIQNNVTTPRLSSVIRFDGGDRIQASKPIAVVKANYPANPGNVLAGAVEVEDTMHWGHIFEAPVGIDMGATQIAFEHSSFTIMASMNNTKVLLSNQTTLVLNIGGTATFSVNQGDRIVADKPLQVHLLTGDVGSSYETRWYSVRAVEMLSNSYVTPVGDSIGKTKLIIYNPNPTNLTYTLYYLEGGMKKNITGNVMSKKSAWSPVIPLNSGGWINGSMPFLPLTVTDTEATDGDNLQTNGDMYDWGCPLIPRDELTPYALIGLGFGCTNNNCGGTSNVARNIVWISPLENADIYVDFTSGGVSATMYSVPELGSIRVSDPADRDMSGASIFAVKNGTGINGPLVNIAVAWGQNPAVSRPRQDLSLDMGVVVLPFTNLKVVKVADKAVASVGDLLHYTIRVSSVGPRNAIGGTALLKDVLDESVSYIVNSTKLKLNFGNFSTINIADSSSGTPFPLDVGGYLIPVTIPGRGATIDITFSVQIAHDLNYKSRIVNMGTVSQPSIPDIPYKLITVLDYKPSVAVANTVMLGLNGDLCASQGVESISGVNGTDITYCFNVTNTGQTHLINIQLSNADIGNYNQNINATLAPNQSIMVHTNRKIISTGSNAVVVTASPAYSNGIEISDASAITAQDTSSINIWLPNIAIVNKVYIGADGTGSNCNAAVDNVTDIISTPVTYCFTVSNTGNTWLTNVEIVNYFLNVSISNPAIMAPGSTWTIFSESSIQEDFTNSAFVFGQPVTSSGGVIAGASEIIAADASSVATINFNANVTIDNRVYIGHNNGASCGTANATETVSGVAGTNVTYCFNITNTGNVNLTGAVLTNYEFAFSNDTIPLLAPNQSILITYTSIITGNVTNNAMVSAFPSLSTSTWLAQGGTVPAVLASDPSSVTLLTGINGTVRNGDKDPYKSPSNSTACLNDNWDIANANVSNPTNLLCATNEVYVLSAVAENESSCAIGETITLTIDATFHIASQRGDLGWYVATDGGDALTGTCAVNGLQDNDGTTYVIETGDPSFSANSYVAWSSTGGADNDQCGDVFIAGSSGGEINTPILVDTEISCQDEDDDGYLDVAICFTWKGSTNNVACTLSNHVPGSYNECYCSRIDITNVAITLPPPPDNSVACS